MKMHDSEDGPVRPVNCLSSDQIKLARRRLDAAAFVSNEFEVHRLRERLAGPGLSLEQRSDCFKAIAALTMVEQNRQAWNRRIGGNQ